MKNKYTNPDGHDAEMIELAFHYFVDGVRKKIEHHGRTSFPSLPIPTVTVNSGSVYWKIVRNDGVFGFVRKSDGAVLSPASWRSPYTRGNNYIRGYVTDNLIVDAVATPYCIRYAKP